MSAESRARIPPASTAITLLGKGVGIEIFRRKEFYVLLFLMCIYAVGVIIAGAVGIEDAATFFFLLNLGLTFAYLSGHLLALLTAARQVPKELEHRTLYPLLAKPVTRQTYILGKWIATTAAGIATLFLLALLSFVPWLVFPEATELSGLLFLQMIVLGCLSIALVAALGLLLSLVVPPGVSLTVIALFFLFWNQAKAFLLAWYGDGPAAGFLGWVLQYIPDFSKLNLVTRYTDGVGPLGASEFLGLAVYGGLITALALLLTGVLFERRQL